MKIIIALLGAVVLFYIFLICKNGMCFKHLYLLDYDFHNFLPDIWWLLKKLFFLPGDFLLATVSYVIGMKTLFDMAHEGYRIFASATISIICWVLIIAMLLDVWGTFRGYCEKNF